MRLPSLVAISGLLVACGRPIEVRGLYVNDDGAGALVLCDQPQLLEDLVGMPGAERLREFYVSDDVSPDWLAALRKARGPDPWHHGFFVVDRATRSVIGSAGFKGPPDAAGMVEIAYGIVPGFEGQGFATEGAAALVGFAFASGHVRLVRAHTLPAANPSTRVLLKCGFRD